MVIKIIFTVTLLALLSVLAGAEPDPDDSINPTVNPVAQAATPTQPPIPPRMTDEERRVMEKVCPRLSLRIHDNLQCAEVFLTQVVINGDGTEKLGSNCCNEMALWGRNCVRTVMRILMGKMPAWEDLEDRFYVRIDEALYQCSSTGISYSVPIYSPSSLSVQVEARKLLARSSV